MGGGGADAPEVKEADRVSRVAKGCATCILAAIRGVAVDVALGYGGGGLRRTCLAQCGVRSRCIEVVDAPDSRPIAVSRALGTAR